MNDRALFGLGRLRLAAAVVGLLVVSAGGAYALGVVGAPSVEAVDNRFGDVDDETTVIETDLVVNNPNPIGVQLGETTVEYTVRMNEVSMATGGREGLAVERGNATLDFQTEMNNTRIQPWWVSHVRAGERTEVTIDATVSTSLLGERAFDFTQKREVETDIIGQFNSEETREINADDPPPTAENPILYVNRTAAEWGSVGESETPIDMAFDVYNPQTEPYAITEIGYEITMNDVELGEGATEEEYVIPGGATETIRTEAIIHNNRLGEWWVTHLQNDQVTELRIEFDAVVELPTGEEIRVPLEELTYERTIETDVFDNKDDDRSPEEDDDRGTETPDGDEEDETPTPDGDDEAETPTPTPTPEEDDEEEETQTPTPTPDDGDDEDADDDGDDVLF